MSLSGPAAPLAIEPKTPPTPVPIDPPGPHVIIANTPTYFF